MSVESAHSASEASRSSRSAEAAAFVRRWLGRLLLASLLVIFLYVAWAVPYPTGPREVPPSVVDALYAADQFDLLSLDPIQDRYPAPDAFHSYKVLGIVEITDRATRAQLIRALQKSAAHADMVKACFDPRHGIRARRNGRDVDILICFQCAYAHVLEGTQITHGFGVSDSQQAFFNSVLRRAGVPLPSR